MSGQDISRCVAACHADVALAHRVETPFHFIHIMNSMTASTPDLGDQLAALRALSSRLAGRDGDELRACIQRITEIAGAVGATAAERAALPARAAAELEHLVAAIGQLAELRGPAAGALRGIDVTPVVDQLRAFAAYLRAPTGETRAKIRALISGLPGGDADPQPSPRDAWIAALARDAARAGGLAEDAVDEVVERATRTLALPVRQLELAAQHDAARASTAARLDPLLDAMIASGSALGPALAAQRAEIAHAFRRVDLGHMAGGLRVLSAWLATPARDTAAHVAALRDQLAEALGPPTLAEPAASDADRRAELEREVTAAVERAVRELSV